MATIAEKLLAYRKKSDKSQTEMAELLGVSQQVYSNWENQKKKINEDELQLIFDKTGVVQDFIVIPPDSKKWSEVNNNLTEIKSSLTEILDEQLYARSQHLAMIQVDAEHRGGDAEIQRIHSLTVVAFEAMKKMDKSGSIQGRV